ncbi:GroES-like protein [Obba rivulosa]|uniref:GroES-like protein n=1 Tax=Obba rivulosa TaxID=1052685 RepID=A0A8E2DGG7_9APHY|nr:GroES-like protein [Obba rivulosa]
MAIQQKALLLKSKHGQFVVENIPVPAPGPDQVLVRVEAAALNPVDWMIQAYGILREDYPAILGFDGAGIVEQVGEAVQGLAKGDRIIFQGGYSNSTATFKQYTLTTPGVSAKVPDSITSEQAASIPIGLVAAALGLFDPYTPSGSAKLFPPWEEGGRGKYAGKPIVIIGGSSSVGEFAIQLAKLAGFSPLITTASPRNAGALKALGATHVVDRNLPADALAEEVAKITSLPIEVALDAISLPTTQNAAYDILAPSGQLVVVLQDAVAAEKKAAQPNKTIVEVHGSLAAPGHLKAAASLCSALTGLLEEGAIKPMHVEVLPGGLAGVVDGLERLKNNQVSATKLVVHPQETQ